MRLKLVNMGLFSQATPFMGVVVDHWNILVCVITARISV